MREELEPCPFCGTTASHGVVTEGGEANPDFGGHFIQCDNPNCHGCMGLRFSCGDDPKPHLAAAWNTRAPISMAAEIERLRGIVRGWHYLAVGPDEMGDYYTHKQLIKLSEPYASPSLKALEARP